MQKQTTGIQAKLKTGGIELISELPDNDVEIVFVPSEDIRTLYGCTPTKFMERHQEDEALLNELYISVTGISVS
jgi:hypothetical protein